MHHRKHFIDTRKLSPHWQAQFKPLGNGNSQGRYKFYPLFIIYLRDVWQGGKRDIFLGQHVESIIAVKNHKKQQNSRIPLISSQRETLESHFFKASMFRLYKYQSSPLQSLWVSAFIAQDERRREHLTGTIKRHHCHGKFLFFHWSGHQQRLLIRDEVLHRGHHHSRKDTFKWFHLHSPRLHTNSFWHHMFTENNFCHIYLYAKYVCSLSLAAHFLLYSVVQGGTTSLWLI